MQLAMKNGQCAQEIQSSTPASHESHGEQKNNQSIDAPVQDSGSVSASSDSRKVSRQDIELVQNLIERCLQLYMNRDEVVKTLLTRASIDPGFTTLVWQKLEEENADFFRAYYIRLKLKKQIIMFNYLLEHQCNLMKYPHGPPKIPLAPIQNGIHPMALVNMPMGYPVLQHPQMHAPGHPHIDPMGISSCHVVNGVPAPANYQQSRTNTTNDTVVDTTMNDATPQVIPPNSGGMLEMAASPASVASSGPFPFSASDMPDIGMDTSVLDSAFTADVVPDKRGAGNLGDSLRSFDQIPWNFSLSDLTADLSNLGDLGALGNYPGSPFLPSDSEIFLDSSEQEDIEEFFVDSVPGPRSKSDKDNP